MVCSWQDDEYEPLYQRVSGTFDTCTRGRADTRWCARSFSSRDKACSTPSDVSSLVMPSQLCRHVGQSELTISEVMGAYAARREGTPFYEKRFG